jgi:polysaccharide export outer membrane protein
LPIGACRATSIEDPILNTITRVVAAAVTAVALAGCMPGQYMSDKGPGTTNLVNGGEVQVVPITAELVSPERAAETIPQELLAYEPEEYRINSGDTLIVTVWDHPELTTPAGSQQETIANGRLVRPDGTIYFPYAGKVQVAGKTISQVRDDLSSRLGKYLRDPQVDINVAGFGSRIALQGAFANTAPQDISTVPLTLAQAVGRAGIDVQNADISGLVLTRERRSYRLDLDALNRNGVAPDIYLKPGDHLYLPFNDRKEVYVVGEVLRPMAINFKTTDMSLTQALGRAGGLDPVTSKGSAVYVIRGMDNMQKAPATVYHLNAKSPAAFVLADRFSLHPGDVVWVGPAGITRWNRYLTQLLPLTGIIRNAANADQDFSNN